MNDMTSFEPFACAPGMRLQAHEKLTELHQEQLRAHLERVEEAIARLERRIWLAVSGVAAAVIGQALQQILA